MQAFSCFLTFPLPLTLSIPYYVIYKKFPPLHFVNIFPLNIGVIYYLTCNVYEFMTKLGQLFLGSFSNFSTKQEIMV